MNIQSRQKKIIPKKENETGSGLGGLRRHHPFRSRHMLTLRDLNQPFYIMMLEQVINTVFFLPDVLY